MAKLRKWLLHPLLLMVLAVSILLTAFTPMYASAEGEEEITYSNVLDDLGKDERFDVNDYPVDPDDYTLQLIQVAESEAQELFIYVYNPSWQGAPFTATKISMYESSQPAPGEFTPSVYDLELLSSESGFSKYVLKNYKQFSAGDRYYHIIGLYRDFNPAYDNTPDNTITDSICHNVGQIWCLYYEGDKLLCEVQTMETLELNVTFNGRFRYSGGISWGAFAGLTELLDSHFIAFNATDYQVKHIYDADMEYRLKSEKIASSFSAPEYSDYGDVIKVTLKDSDKVTYSGGGLFSREYNWSRIMTSQEYVTNYEAQGGTISKEVKNQLLSSQWVFAFAETEVTDVWQPYYHSLSYVASEVSILRIHFLDNYGKEYNLGVIANVTSEDSVPDGSAGSGLPELPDISDLFADVEKIAKIIVVLILGCILIGLINFVLGLFKRKKYK